MYRLGPQTFKSEALPSKVFDLNAFGSKISFQVLFLRFRPRPRAPGRNNVPVDRLGPKTFKSKTLLRKVIDLKVFGSWGGFPAPFLDGGAIPAAGGSRTADTASPCPRWLDELIPAVGGRRRAKTMTPRAFWTQKPQRLCPVKSSI